jgi:hypothetical protein
MKVGDIVKFKTGGNGREMLGTVLRLDVDWYGARQAFKIYKEVPRGNTIRPEMVDGIGPTEKGIDNRVLVLWCNELGYEYVMGDEVEVVCESR